MKNKNNNNAIGHVIVLFWVFIIIMFTIIRHFLLNYMPQVVISGYLFMFVIAFSIAFAISHCFHIALLIATLIIYGRMIYRYNAPKNVIQNSTSLPSTILFVIGIISIVIVSYLLIPYNKSLIIQYSLFFMITYLIVSIGEWFLHKKVLHCFHFWPWLYNNKFTNPILLHLQNDCKIHHAHHIYTKDDMTLSHIDDENELLFCWKTLAIIALISPFILISVVRILRLRIPIKVQIITMILFTLVFGIVWNGSHPQTHSVQNISMPITEGPVWKSMPYPNIIETNHEMHHRIKGKDKGNFNVVFLGADELFNSNNLFKF